MGKEGGVTQCDGISGANRGIGAKVMPDKDAAVMGVMKSRRRNLLKVPPRAQRAEETGYQPLPDLAAIHAFRGKTDNEMTNRQPNDQGARVDRIRDEQGRCGISWNW